MDGGESVHGRLGHSALSSSTFHRSLIGPDICWRKTIASLTAFVLMMCLHPQAQKRAQDEIDKVIGSDRLPSFADMPNLPYVSACVKETLRYWTVAPLGIHLP